jgi:hypothetical protein
MNTTFCPNCGAQAEIGAKFCLNCGFEFDTFQNQNDSSPYAAYEAQQQQSANESPVSEKKPKGIPYMYVMFGFAFAILIMAFLAANSIKTGGDGIRIIQSVGGQTLEEAYYSELGIVYSGFAMFVRAAGLFFAAVLAWLGLRTKRVSENSEPQMDFAMTR